MTASAIANAFVCLTFLVACFRARLVALALAPPVLLILACALDLVDLSSASHPLRWIVPVACAGLAGFAAWVYRKILASYDEHGHLVVALCNEQALQDARSGATRGLIASILVLASNGPDLLALHPFFWAKFQTWPLNPLTIGLCGTICAILVAPERWVRKWV